MLQPHLLGRAREPERDGEGRTLAAKLIGSPDEKSTAARLAASLREASRSTTAPSLAANLLATWLNKRTHDRAQTDAADKRWNQFQDTVRIMRGDDPAALSPAAARFLETFDADPSIYRGNETLQRGLLNALTTAPQERWEVVHDPYGRGGVGQQSSRTGEIRGWQGPIPEPELGDFTNWYNPDTDERQAVQQGSPDEAALAAEDWLKGNPSSARGGDLTPAQERENRQTLESRNLIAKAIGEGRKTRDQLMLETTEYIQSEVPYLGEIRLTRNPHYNAQTARNLKNATRHLIGGADPGYRYWAGWFSGDEEPHPKTDLSVPAQPQPVAEPTLDALSAMPGPPSAPAPDRETGSDASAGLLSDFKPSRFFKSLVPQAIPDSEVPLPMREPGWTPGVPNAGSWVERLFGGGGPAIDGKPIAEMTMEEASAHIAPGASLHRLSDDQLAALRERLAHLQGAR